MHWQNRMTVQTGWYEVGRVYYLQFSGVVETSDVRWAIRLSRSAIVDYRDHVGHSVTDVSQVTQFNLPLRDFIDALEGLHEIKGRGWATVIGSRATFINFSLQTISQHFGFRLAMFPTLEAGLTFLNQVDHTLPPLLPVREIEWQPKISAEHDIL